MKEYILWDYQYQLLSDSTPKNMKEIVTVSLQEGFEFLFAYQRGMYFGNFVSENGKCPDENTFQFYDLDRILFCEAHCLKYYLQIRPIYCRINYQKQRHCYRLSLLKKMQTKTDKIKLKEVVVIEAQTLSEVFLKTDQQLKQHMPTDGNVIYLTKILSRKDDRHET